MVRERILITVKTYPTLSRKYGVFPVPHERQMELL